MSGYRLCQTKTADVPYYIENISTNIYSLEELCFYIHHNIYLLDETIINEGLCDWLRDELGLKKLYHVLYKELENEGALGEFILPIFKEIGYLSHQEFKDVNNVLTRLEHEPEISRQKLKADYLVENGKYINAIKFYKAILNQVKGSKIGGQFVGEVYHNMGCAHMRMFQYEDAVDCFSSAYASLHTESMLLAYLTAYYVANPVDKYMKELERLEVDELLGSQVEERITSLRASITLNDMGNLKAEFLERLTKEYHNSTDH